VFTDIQIINLGLGKIAEAQIERIDPPRTSLERFIAAGYTSWRNSELAKRRWVFATEYDFPLALVASDLPGVRKYKYSLPTDCLRPIREKGVEWRQSGRFIQSSNSALTIPYVINVPEADFDPLFVEVLAERVALESVEYVTQSNSKRQSREVNYVEAVADASRNNAFVIGPEDNTSDDEAYGFLEGRINGRA